MYCVIGALSRRNDDPAAGSRPFDRDRDGFVTGGGGGDPGAGGAGPRPGPGGEDLRRAGRLRGHRRRRPHHPARPVRHPGRPVHHAWPWTGPADHPPTSATSTPTARARPSTTRPRPGPSSWPSATRLATVPVSSTKSMTGHLTGAAGALEAMITLMAIHDGFLPPTINLDHPDPECDLNHVAHVGREAPGLDLALSTSFGFGGHNACLAFARRCRTRRAQPTVRSSATAAADDQVDGAGGHRDLPVAKSWASKVGGPSAGGRRARTRRRPRAGSRPASGCGRRAGSIGDADLDHEQGRRVEMELADASPAGSTTTRSGTLR